MPSGQETDWVYSITTVPGTHAGHLSNEYCYSRRLCARVSFLTKICNFILFLNKVMYSKDYEYCFHFFSYLLILVICYLMLQFLNQVLDKFVYSWYRYVRCMCHISVGSGGVTTYVHCICPGCLSFKV